MFPKLGCAHKRQTNLRVTKKKEKCNNNLVWLKRNVKKFKLLLIAASESEVKSVLECHCLLHVTSNPCVSQNASVHRRETFGSTKAKYERFRAKNDVFCTRNIEKWLSFGATFTAFIAVEPINSINLKCISILECMWYAACCRQMGGRLSMRSLSCELCAACVCAYVWLPSLAGHSGNIMNITFQAFASRSTANN